LLLKLLKLTLILGLVFPLFASANEIKIKKQNFYNLVVPAVNQVYTELDTQYKLIQHDVEQNDINTSLVREMMKKYKAKDYQDLLQRMKPHPKSVALAQAAMESGWATSRFTKVANNLFGVWSFNKNEPRVPASQKRGNKTIYVKKYKTIADSIRDYYKVLATGRAFSEFRAQKMRSEDPYKLVKKLDKYSEKGSEYGKELAQVIRYNKFYNY